MRLILFFLTLLSYQWLLLLGSLVLGRLTISLSRVVNHVYSSFRLQLEKHLDSLLSTATLCRIEHCCLKILRNIWGWEVKLSDVQSLDSCHGGTIRILCLNRDLDPDWLLRDWLRLCYGLLLEELSLLLPISIHIWFHHHLLLLHVKIWRVKHLLLGIA